MGTGLQPSEQARVEHDPTVTGSSPGLADAINRLRYEMRWRFRMRRRLRAIPDIFAGTFCAVLMLLGLYVLVYAFLEWTAYWALP